jgi:hypothetical protein
VLLAELVQAGGEFGEVFGHFAARMRDLETLGAQP